MTKPPKAKTNDAAAAELREVLATNLRMVRAATRITQRDLAAASGISQRHISFVELGRANISIDALAALANALPGVTAADLLTPPTRRPG